MPKYEATRSTGEVVKRTSPRAYTHAVIGGSQVCWCSSERLARGKASTLKKYCRPGTEPEILEAKVVG